MWTPSNWLAKQLDQLMWIRFSFIRDFSPSWLRSRYTSSNTIRDHHEPSYSHIFGVRNTVCVSQMPSNNSLPQPTKSIISVHGLPPTYGNCCKLSKLFTVKLVKYFVHFQEIQLIQHHVKLKKDKNLKKNKVKRRFNWSIIVVITSIIQNRKK